MKQRSKLWLLMVLVLLVIPMGIQAQSSDLVASMTVLQAGVEVRRVDTANWVPVNKESLVGVGDDIRTDATGSALITFFADGVDTTLLANTEYVIQRFEGDATSYQLSVQVLLGQTQQRIERALDAGSSYEVTTPTMSLAARGTAFAVRVDDGGQRAAMLVTKGTVQADADTGDAAVPPDYGIRRTADAPLSDVVQASTFEQLDAALDGCPVVVTTPDDVSLNVRIAPDRSAQQIGTIMAQDIGTFYGKTENTGWYRLQFQGYYGWVLSSSATVADTCAGLRVFPDNYGPEDTTRYSPPIDLGTPMPEATSESTN